MLSSLSHEARQTPRHPLAALAGSTGAIDRSLRLLRGTNQPIAFYRVSIDGVDCAGAARLVEGQFAGRGIVELLDDGAVALLCLSDDSEDEADWAVAARLRRALIASGFGRSTACEVAGIRRRAFAIADLDDLLAELTTREATAEVAAAA